MHRHLIETAVYFFFLEPARLELFLSLLWRENEVNDSGKITNIQSFTLEGTSVDLLVQPAHG